MKGRIKPLKLSHKIIIGFVLIIGLILFNALYTSNSLESNLQRVSTISEEIDPSMDAIEQLKILVKDSRAYTTNWVYVKNNEVDKKSLQTILDEKYPGLNEKLEGYMARWESEEEKSLATKSLHLFDSLIAIERGIMSELGSDDDYEDLVKILNSEEAVETAVIPLSAEIVAELDKLLEMKKQVSDSYKAEMQAAFSNMQKILLFLGILAIAAAVLISLFLTRIISNPVNKLKQVIDKMRVGEVPEEVRIKSKDEIGQMGDAVNNLIGGIRNYAEFANQVGSGQLDGAFQPLGPNDILGQALLTMRNNLMKVAEDDSKRNWVIQGQAQFADILRNNNSEISELANHLLSNLVKYLKANQGAMYVIEQEEGDDPYLIMKACYAWGKKKFLNQRIGIGEGLVGQCALEQDVIYMTEVPEDYINIGSGLGTAPPRAVILLPLKLNDEVIGVLELASFNPLDDHEKEFLLKLSESIASTISSVKVNERTQKLLDASNMLTNELKAQEEEMRQNQEELMATQEEASRKLAETERELEDLRAKLAEHENASVERLN